MKRVAPGPDRPRAVGAQGFSRRFRQKLSWFARIAGAFQDPDGLLPLNLIAGADVPIRADAHETACAHRSERGLMLVQLSGISCHRVFLMC
jgi:hypothetical protein